METKEMSSERPGNAAAGVKKTKTVRVKQEYIDWLLTRGPVVPYPFIAEECILHLKPKYREGIRAVRIKATRDEEEGILEQ